ncbi:MAG: hypothetical protein ACJ8F7_03970 [Gemmataceae bacterium]
MIRFPCPECGHHLHAPDGSADKTMRCPECRATVRVPEAGSADKQLVGPVRELAERSRDAGRKKKKKPAPAPRKGLSLAVYAAIGGGVLVVVITIVGVVVFVLGRKPLAGGADRPLARETKPPADQVAVLDIPVGESWKVEPDAGEAPASGGRSAFVLADTVRAEGIYFGAPASGKVAVVQLARREPRNPVGPQVNIPVRREWVQYDIKSATPLGRVELLPDAGVVAKDKRVWYAGDQGEKSYFSSAESDLSPSGAFLAHRAAADQPFDIWSRDGQKSHTLAMKGSAPVQWLRFLDDASLLVSTGKELVLRGVKNDAPTVFSVALLAPQMLALSPGRQYCVAAGPEKITWYRLKDGSVAGTIPLPRGQDVQVKAACHSPDGTKFALLLLDGGKGALYVWNTKTGQPIFGKKLIYARLIDYSIAEKVMYWATPRMLVIDRAVFDAVAGFEHGAYDLPASTCLARASGDGRTWGIAFYGHTSPGKDPIDEFLPAFDQAKDKEVVKANRTLLAACSSLPRQFEDKLAANEKGNGWHPNLAVRVEVECPHDNDKAFLRAAAEKLADTIAAMGIRVDPQAPVLAKLTIAEPKLMVKGRSNLQMKLELQGPDGKVWHLAGLNQEPVIPSGDAIDKPKFRARTLDVIGNYAPVPTTLLDNPLTGQINTYVLHAFLPDGLPPRITRS